MKNWAFYYVGPIDGHNLDHLIPVLENVRDDPQGGPVFDPCRYAEGSRLCSPAEAAADKLHAVQPKFNIVKTDAEKRGGKS